MAEVLQDDAIANVQKTELDDGMNDAEDASSPAAEGPENVESDSWVKELEEALTERCGLYDVCRIVGGQIFPSQLRGRAWMACLDVDSESERNLSEITGWDGTFNLPSQQLLRDDCQELTNQTDSKGDVDALVLRSDLESLLTAVCSQQNIDYDAENGWKFILKVLLRLDLSPPCLQQMFITYVQRFVPRNGRKNDVVYHLFRLIVLYHDPELCNYLDSRKISFEKFSSSWFSTLLSANCSEDTILPLWDIYIQNNDPFLVFFLGLVLLLSKRDDIFDMKDASRDELTDFLSKIPKDMAVEDVVDFYQVANSYLAQTPLSLREANWTTLFGTRPVSPTKRLHIPIPQAMCLPVTIDELVSSPHKSSGCRFFAIDCRPPEQYNAGHLVTAFHLDAQLLLQNSATFDAAVDRLLQSQKEALDSNSISGGEHLCFMGSGFEAEDQFVHMVVARMLQKHHKFVSMADGGYEALLYYIEVNGLEWERVLAGTEVSKLAAKHKKQHESKPLGNILPASKSLFGKLTSAVKNQIPVVKDKIANYMSNPSASSTTPIRHVSAQERSHHRKFYRPSTSVFVFDDEHDDEFTGDGLDFPEGEPQNWKEFVRRPDVIAHFECLEYVSMEEAVPALLVISETDIYNFRMSTEHPDMATLVAQHGMSEVLKIVCRKKIPELITIKYGTMEDRVATVTDIERFYIGKSGDAIKAIKTQVLKMMADHGEQPFSSPTPKTEQVTPE